MRHWPMLSVEFFISHLRPSQQAFTAEQPKKSGDTHCRPGRREGREQQLVHSSWKSQAWVGNDAAELASNGAGCLLELRRVGQCGGGGCFSAG